MTFAFPALLLGVGVPAPPILIGALLAGSLVLAATRADMNLLARWSLVGGWFVFALTSPTAEFPTMLRPLGLLVATAGAVILRLNADRLVDTVDRVIPIPTRLLFIYIVFVFFGCMASPLGPKNVVRWVQGVMIIATVFYAVALGFTRALLASTFVAALLNVVLTVASGRGEILPDGTATNRLSGYMQPNHLAFICALVVIGVVWLWREQPTWRIPLAGCGLIATYALLASHSRTALLALIAALGAAVAAALIDPNSRGRTAAWVIAGVLMLTPVVLPTFGTWFNRDDSEQSITSLTGRTDFWPLAGELIEQRPVIGWGVNVILSPAGHKFQDVLPGVGQAHNAYLEAALMSGLPGAFAWAMSLLGIVIGSLRLPRSDPYRFLLIAGAILVHVFAFTESSPAWFGDMFIIYMLALAIYGESRIKAAAAARPAPAAGLTRAPHFTLGRST